MLQLQHAILAVSPNCPIGDLEELGDDRVARGTEWASARGELSTKTYFSGFNFLFWERLPFGPSDGFASRFSNSLTRAAETSANSFGPNFISSARTNSSG